MAKTKFLEDVGLIQNPNEAERALKSFRGRGEELQERFDCIVNAGLDRKDRIKLRLSMYNWLTEQGKAVPMLSLSTLIAFSDNTFMKRFVNQHPEGPRVLKDLKKQIYSEQ
ncbi:hypothetical protein Patl1_33014 [Pistacia atlantica]|uniref:Uncharacterized protein n=1 Tax=Pistacia atlantica TaxID=434234 RepID=A0ACC1AM74_9ROSI|nr:hypothetical protein Patl1_33014 [Pistacia atlantica]